MLKKLDKFAVFSAVLFIAVFLFWWLYRPEAMYYQEIFQLFLWDSAYFMEVTGIPGGLAEYIGEFLVQFYYYPAAGAFIIAALMTSICHVSYKIAQTIHGEGFRFSLWNSIPAMFLWYIMRDFNVMHNLMAAILMALLISWLCLAAIRRGSPSAICAALASIPAGYFLFGPVVYIPLILSAIQIIRQKMSPLYIIGTALALTLVMAISIHYVQYPIPRFFFGINYFRYHIFNPWILAAILLHAVVPAIRLRFLEADTWKTSAAQAAVLAGAILAIGNAYEYYKYQTIKYLNLVHECRWKDIIADAEKNPPRTPFAMQPLNTALAFEHQLLDRMFSFPQDAFLSLVPRLENNMLHPLLIADAFYWMGLLDHATHYYFESKTGNPTYRGSRFAYMRLAECYMISGDYGVAGKYLMQLGKTLFFKKMANEYLYLLETGTVDQHPIFSTLRKVRLRTDAMQDVSLMDRNFENLIKQNPQNYLAFEYLMGLRLLRCELMEVANGISLGNQLQYNGMPRHLQEAMIVIYENQKGNPQNLPAYISSDVKARYNQKIWTDGSYWPYLLKNKDMNFDYFEETNKANE